jgi:hypothetical protein
MIVMYHKFGYEQNGKKETNRCNQNGLFRDDQTYTAMAKPLFYPLPWPPY